MRLSISLLLLSFVCSSLTLFDDLYSLSINDINGTKIELSQFRGKKIMFVILPLFEQDSVIIEGLVNFQKESKNLIVIGILSNELGFKPGAEVQIKSMYSVQRNSSIILTEAMNIRKGSEQSPLLQWLTNKDKNKIFDNEVRGINYRFFVDESGKLFAIIEPEANWKNPVFNKILSRPVVK